jgi:hypothetical protein
MVYSEDSGTISANLTLRVDHTLTSDEEDVIEAVVVALLVGFVIESFEAPPITFCKVVPNELP